MPATPLTNPFATTPGQPATLPFQLQVPPNLPNSVPQQVSYHLRTTADIPGEVDPGSSIEIQIVGGVLMIAVGVALVTGYWAEFIDLVRRLFVSNTVMPI